jgi:hypothetical protein
MDNCVCSFYDTIIFSLEIVGVIVLLAAIITFLICKFTPNIFTPPIKQDKDDIN